MKRNHHSVHSIQPSLITLAVLDMLHGFHLSQKDATCVITKDDHLPVFQYAPELSPSFLKRSIHPQQTQGNFTLILDDQPTLLSIKEITRLDLERSTQNQFWLSHHSSSHRELIHLCPQVDKKNVLCLLHFENLRRLQSNLRACFTGLPEEEIIMTMKMHGGVINVAFDRKDGTTIKPTGTHPDLNTETVADLIKESGKVLGVERWPIMVFLPVSPNEN